MIHIVNPIFIILCDAFFIQFYLSYNLPEIYLIAKSQKNKLNVTNYFRIVFFIDVVEINQGIN